MNPIYDLTAQLATFVEHSAFPFPWVQTLFELSVGGPGAESAKMGFSTVKLERFLYNTCH